MRRSKWRAPLMLAACLSVSALASPVAVRLGITTGDAASRSPAHRATQTGAPSVSLDSTSLDFGDQVVKKSSPPKRITLTNTGGKALYLNSASLTAEEEWKDFAVAKDTCTGATVPPGKSCVVDVTFTPAETGDRNATLVLKDDAPDSPQSVTMSGTGINSIDVPPF